MSTVAIQAIQQELVDAFVESTKQVFAMMLETTIELGECRVVGKFETTNDLSGIIGLTGEIVGTVIVRIDQDVAIAVAEKLTGQVIGAEDDDVREMTGELASQIAGNAKSRLTDKKVTLSLPTIISGPGHRISFEPGARIQRICFRSQWGLASVELGFRAN